MDASRFDEIIKKLIIKCKTDGSQENAVTTSSKLLEIDYTMRNIDQQLVDCKTLIIETLKCFESTTLVLYELGTERQQIATLDDELRHFYENLARPRMTEIEKIRDLIHVEMKNDEDCKQRLAEERERIRKELNSSRDEFLNELTSVEQNINILEMQLEDTTKKTKFIKMENAKFQESLEEEKRSLQRQSDESVIKLNKLLNRSSDR